MSCSTFSVCFAKLTSYVPGRELGKGSLYSRSNMIHTLGRWDWLTLLLTCCCFLFLFWQMRLSFFELKKCFEICILCTIDFLFTRSFNIWCITVHSEGQGTEVFIHLYWLVWASNMTFFNYILSAFMTLTLKFSDKYSCSPK